LSDRLLPLLVAAMTFLAALALAGAVAASSLAAHWAQGAAAMLTVQVPDPGGQQGGLRREDAVAAALRAAPGVAGARRLPDSEVAALLRPWLGQDPAALSLTLPALFQVQLAENADSSALETRLLRAAPGTLVEHNGDWLARLRVLIRSLQACAALALLLVAGTAAAMVAVATRAGLAARRDAIEIVHGLGATDGLIAGQFAGRVGWLTLAGSVPGVVLAVPVLLGLASLASPFVSQDQAALRPDPTPLDLLRALPAGLWVALPVLPAGALLIGWGTAQATVRLWLGRLP
jgi:cell division transport system permease protein